MGDRYRCPYCLGRFKANADAVYCSGSCKQAAHHAMKWESPADLPMAIGRRAKPSAERRAATGFATVSPEESVNADLRVRCLAAGEVHTRRQLEAAVAFIGSVAGVAMFIGVDVEELRSQAIAWGIDEREVLREVSWSWRRW